MLIQNTSSTVSSAPRLASDSVPVSVAAPKTGATADELRQVATNAVAEQQATQPNIFKPTAAQIQNAVDSINKVMLQNNANVEFSIDKETRQTVIKVVESRTGDVIRQFPSEEVMAIAREIDRVQQGLLLKQQA